MPLWQEMTVGKGGYPRAYVQPPGVDAGDGRCARGLSEGIYNSSEVCITPQGVDQAGAGQQQLDRSLRDWQAAGTPPSRTELCAAAVELVL